MRQPQANLFTALQEAKEKGFTDDFFLNEDGDFVSSSQEIVPPIIIEIIPCHDCGATLYLVAGNCKRGTWVHHRD